MRATRSAMRVAPACSRRSMTSAGVTDRTPFVSCPLRWRWVAADEVAADDEDDASLVVVALAGAVHAAGLDPVFHVERAGCVPPGVELGGQERGAALGEAVGRAHGALPRTSQSSVRPVMVAIPTMWVSDGVVWPQTQAVMVVGWTPRRAAARTVQPTSGPTCPTMAARRRSGCSG